MAEQGQIFSVDFLISVAVIVLALAVIVQALELSNHARQQDFNQRELSETARLASQLLVSNQAWTCELDLGREAMRLDNCLDSGKQINKDGLGLGEEFGCEVRGLGVQGCGQAPNNVLDVVGLKRVVVFGSRMSLEEFRACRQGRECGVTEPKEIEVRVWRK